MRHDYDMTQEEYNRDNVINYYDDDICSRCGGSMWLIHDDLPNGPRFCPSCG